jgi:RNA polymerase sigma-70 factor (ECF subfamily)
MRAGVVSDPGLGIIATMFGITDEQAMWRVSMHDDAHAFARILDRWQSPIHRLCARMLGDHHRGQDLAQETFARLFARRKEYRQSGKFSTFIWRVALNICYDELRKLKRRQESSLDGGEAGPDTSDLWESNDPGPDALASREEDAARVRSALMQLPEIYRSVLVLRHYEDLKFREIAEVLEIAEGTVKSRMAEGLSQMHRLLRGTGLQQQSRPDLPERKLKVECMIL